MFVFVVVRVVVKEEVGGGVCEHESQSQHEATGKLKFRSVCS